MTKTEKIEERIKDELTPVDTDEAYKQYLDDCFGTVNIAGMEFNTSHALEELDPTAYRCGLSDWLDQEGYYELDGEYYNMDEVNTIINEVEDEEE